MCLLLPLALTQLPARSQLRLKLSPLCVYGCDNPLVPACLVPPATVARLLAWLAALSRVVAVYLAVYNNSYAAVAFNKLADTTLSLSGLVQP